METLYGAIGIHKHVFQAAVFDAASGEIVEARFPATSERIKLTARPRLSLSPTPTTE